MPSLSALNDQFAVEGQLVFEEASDDLVLAKIKNRYAVADIALQGAQVINWFPINHQPVIWLSQAARFIAGKSLRGGIPICWPWFGPHPREPSLPSHGFARTQNWKVIETAALDDGRTHIKFCLPESETPSRFWPYKTSLEISIIVGEMLEISLHTRNLAEATITLTEALHSYFAVGDIEQVKVYGLEDTEYLDKVDAGQRKLQHGPVVIESEVDRIYLGTRAECIIEDSDRQRKIYISKQGSNSTVVWNPWLEKANRLGDMGDNGYRQMLCIESANAAEDEVTIPPGESHQLRVSYRVEALV